MRRLEKIEYRRYQLEDEYKNALIETYFEEETNWPTYYIEVLSSKEEYTDVFDFYVTETGSGLLILKPCAIHATFLKHTTFSKYIKRFDKGSVSWVML